MDKQARISSLATRGGYAFLAKNRSLIQQEFNHLYSILNKMQGIDQNLRLRCHYYCELLRQYYEAHNEPRKAEAYRRKAASIIPSNDPIAPAQANPPILSNTYQFLGVDGEPDGLGKIYQFWGNANMLRLEAAFSRVTVRQALAFASTLQWTNLPVDLSQMISVIDSPTPVFNALSLGLFACRFSINISQIIQHTWFPTEEENDGTFSACERFCKEVYERQYHLLNDVVWFSVNLFCNYNTFWNLSDLFAGELTAIFLVFDALWLVWSRHLLEETYLIKKEQYEQEKIWNSANIENLDERTEKNSLLDQQLQELEIEWQKNNANYLFSVAAAGVFTAGYSATLLFAAPAAIAFNFFICTIAVAMYLSADDFAHYLNTSYVLELQANHSPADQNNLSEARNKFIIAMLKNTFMPLLVVTFYAVCWPAAVACTVLYVSHSLLAETNPPALSAPSAEIAANDDHSDASSDDSEIGQDHAGLLCWQ